MDQEAGEQQPTSPGTGSGAKGTGARIYDRPARKGGKSTLLLLGLILLVTIVLWLVL